MTRRSFIVLSIGVVIVLSVIAIPSLVRPNQADYDRRQEFGRIIRERLKNDPRFSECFASWCCSCRSLGVRGTVETQSHLTALSNIVLTADCPFQVDFIVRVKPRNPPFDEKETFSGSLAAHPRAPVPQLRALPSGSPRRSVHRVESRTMARHISLSPTNRVDEQFKIKLISVDSSGVATISFLDEPDIAQVAPSNYLAPSRLGKGVRLLNTSYSNQMALFQGAWPEGESGLHIERSRMK